MCMVTDQREYRTYRACHAHRPYSKCSWLTSKVPRLLHPSLALAHRSHSASAGQHWGRKALLWTSYRQKMQHEYLGSPASEKAEEETCSLSFPEQPCRLSSSSQATTGLVSHPLLVCFHFLLDSSPPQTICIQILPSRSASWRMETTI